MMDQFKDFVARVIVIALVGFVIVAAVSIVKVMLLVLASFGAVFAAAWALDRLGAF